MADALVPHKNIEAETINRAFPFLGDLLSRSLMILGAWLSEKESLIRSELKTQLKTNRCLYTTPALLSFRIDPRK